ncbi:MAG: hypothetical protein BroJett005_30750 [Ignavibacteriota bacterium]|nr:MAG: hypothetical protein BroJett005_30750 [Ignavibacteriota bacterium]
MADLEISCWKDVYDAGYREDRKTIIIPAFFEMIRGNEYKVIIEKIRCESDREKRNLLKMMLPAVTVSGTFRERKLHGLIKHSGFICMDFDDLGQKAEPIRESLKQDRFVSGYFYSASGKGLAVLVRIEPHRHTETFEALERYFFETYGLVADIGCKDITRLRFFSYDPDAYLNLTAQCFNKFPKVDKKPKKHYIEVPATKSDIGKIVQQAVMKQCDITDGSYAEWQRLAASLATLREGGRDYFHALSQFHPKYDPMQTDRKFNNLLNSANGNITIGTFYYFAKRAGLDTNTEKAARIIETCREVKRVKNLTVENAVKRLQDKNIICTDEDETANVEDVELVKKVYEATDVSEIVGIQEIENYIVETWDFRRNEISNQIEWKNGETLEDKDFSEIYIETKKQYPKVNKNDVLDIIYSKAVTYNPLKDFIEVNRYLIVEGKTKGLISELAACICSDSGLTGDMFDAEYEEYFIRKWFVGMISGIYGNPSPLLLALVGSQNTGKTEFFRQLLPKEIKGYYAEPKLGLDKDGAISMTKYLLILDDELSGKSRMEERHMKELTSKKVFSFRPPYGKTNIQKKRLAALCGTTNDESVISDPTGNRRIIPIKVLSIDFERYNAIDKTALFLEAVRLYEQGEKHELTQEDIERLERNTVEHIAENFEREFIGKFFDLPETDAELSFAKFMTTTDILLILEKETNQKLSIRKIGLELRMLKFPRIKKRFGNKTIYGYLLLPNKNTTF